MMKKAMAFLICGVLMMTGCGASGQAQSSASSPASSEAVSSAAESVSEAASSAAEPASEASSAAPESAAASSEAAEPTAEPQSSAQEQAPAESSAASQAEPQAQTFTKEQLEVMAQLDYWNSPLYPDGLTVDHVVVNDLENGGFEIIIGTVGASKVHPYRAYKVDGTGKGTKYGYTFDAVSMVYTQNETGEPCDLTPYAGKELNAKFSPEKLEELAKAEYKATAGAEYEEPDHIAHNMLEDGRHEIILCVKMASKIKSLRAYVVDDSGRGEKFGFTFDAVSMVFTRNETGEYVNLANAA